MLCPYNTPLGVDKAKKRAIRRRAATLTVENGEVFVERRGRKVKVITTVADQNRILVLWTYRLSLPCMCLFTCTSTFYHIYDTLHDYNLICNV